MQEQHPDKTLPSPGPTETQPFRPVPGSEGTRPSVVEHDPNKTVPRMEVPSADHAAREDITPREIVGSPKIYEYGGIKLRDVEVLPNGDRRGTDENGVIFIVPKAEWRMFDTDFVE